MLVHWRQSVGRFLVAFFCLQKGCTSVEETELSLPNPGDAIPVLHRGFKDCPVWCRLKGQRGADDWKSG